MSLRVGAVFVAKVEHLLKDLTDGREWVESSFLYVAQEPLYLWVALHRLFDVPTRTGRRDLEDLSCEIAAAARFQLALRLEPVPMLGDLLPERLEALAPHRLGEHD